MAHAERLGFLWVFLWVFLLFALSLKKRRRAEGPSVLIRLETGLLFLGAGASIDSFVGDASIDSFVGTWDICLMAPIATFNFSSKD